MSAKQTTKKPMTPAQLAWRKKPWIEKIASGKDAARVGVLADPIELAPEEVDAMTVMNGEANGDLIETLAKGKFAKIALENGELNGYGLVRTKRAVKLIVALLGGAKMRKAMEASGLTWMQINVFSIVCPEFGKMFQAARNGMKQAMGADVLDTAYELATEGEELRDKEGKGLVYKKKSEKMLDRLLVMAGGEFRKDNGGGGAGNSGGAGGGITLNFHFDGKGKPSVTAEAVDVG